MSFVNLHVHSEYSLLDGACRIKELIARAKELNQSAIAVTDHGNMYAAVDFWKEAKAQGVKPIIGCEVYVARRTRFDRVHTLDSSPYHLVLLCMNNEGYNNLIKLVSIGFTDGFYNKPRVDIEVLRQYSKGLIALSGCLAGEIAVKLSDGDYNAAKETALLYDGIFGHGNYYIEVQNHKLDEQMRILPYQMRLSKETGIPLAATNDAHYTVRDESSAQRILLCIQTNTTLDEPSAIAFPNDEFYIKSEQEMLELFANCPTAVQNTYDIAQRCNVDFEFGKIKLPKFSIKGVDDNNAFFRDLCARGLKKRYGSAVTEDAKQRMAYELSVIEQMGYTDYFLIVWDYIRFAREHDIPVGLGRGSGAGSLAAYCVGITGIDPLRYKLLFERFLNPERVTMPDFDIDFCYEGRQRVIDYVVEKYGSDRVSQIITFGTLAAKAAVRDVGRAMSMPYGSVDKVAKCIPFENNITIDKALASSKELKEYYDTDGEIHALIDMAKKVENMPRHASTHAAGVLISNAPVTDYVPVQKTDGAIVTQYTMTTLEMLGLLKFDFLGLRNLTIIHDTEKWIRRTVKDFDISKVRDDDPAVYRMLSSGQTSAVFQLEGGGIRSLLMRLNPTTLEDITAATSLYRPGPMDSIPRYLKNRSNPDKITYKHPLLKDILDETCGCMLYQEQVMEICRKLAGYSYGRSDLVRRAMAKKKADVMEKERHSFIYGEKNADGSVNCVGAVANGVPEAVANAIFDEMTSFASYAFNKSHAAAYAMLAYQTAYLRCHYYKEYMAAVMTAYLENTGKITEYMSECEKNGVKILRPDINESMEGFTPTDSGIRFGLIAVKNVGRGLVNAVFTERAEKPFTSLNDFCERLHGRELNKRAIENLIKSGAFDGFNANRRQMMESYEHILDQTADNIRRNLDGQTDLFGMSEDVSSSSTAAYTMPDIDEYPHTELLKMEKEVMGIYLSGHPMNRYSQAAKLRRMPDIRTIIDKAASNEAGYTENSKVSLVCMLGPTRSYTTKNGNEMCFAVIEDEETSIEMIIFPNLYGSVKNRLRNEGEVLFVRAHISSKDESVKLIADDIQSADDFISASYSMGLYVKLASTDKYTLEKLNSLFVSHQGNGRIVLCFTDINKKVSPKSILGVKIDEKMLKELFGIVNADNVALL